MEILGWERWEGHSEAAGIVVNGKLLDMLVTATTGGFEADVVDGAEVLWRGVLPTMAAAKTEAIVQARRAGFRAI
jgi:hypothetical protein